MPLSPRYNFAVVAAYNFDIVTNFSGVFTVTDHWVGDRLAAFGTPVSPQYELSSYDLFGDPPRVVNDPYGEIRAFWQDMPGPSTVFG